MGNVREVRIARRTGFCYGVREAIDKAKEAAAAGKVTHTLGQVVHNEGVIAALAAQGIETVDSLDQVTEGAPRSSFAPTASGRTCFAVRRSAAWT